MALRASRSRNRVPPTDTVTRGPAAFLVRSRRWVLAVIVVLAVLVRIIYFNQVCPGPLCDQHKWDQTDMNYFDQWARAITSGDLISRDVLPPFHGWHARVATAYLRQNPERRALLEREISDLGIREGAELMTAERLQWIRWLGPRHFYQEPAYAYLVALTYKIAGAAVPTYVFFWQMLLGILSVVLIHRIAEDHFGPVVAALAAMLALLCGPLLMHELVLLRDSTIAFAGLLTVFLADRALTRLQWYWWLLAGMSLGFGLELKGIFNIYLLGLLGIIVLHHWRCWKPMAIAGALMVAGATAFMVPAMARNVAVGVSPTAVAGNAGFAFIQNNSPAYDWRAPALVEETYFPALLGKTDGKLLPGVIETLKSHPSTWSVAKMVAGKFDASWHWWERPDNASYYSYRMFAPVLGLMLTFALIAPLALVGLVLVGPPVRRHLTLYLLLLTGLAPMVIFNVMGRFRLPLLTAAIPFAALAVVRIVEWARSGNWARAALAALAVCAVAFWTARPLPTGMSELRPQDYSVPLVIYYFPQAADLERSGNDVAAIRLLEQYLTHEPESILAVGPAHPISSNLDYALATDFAQVHSICARLYQAVGDRPQSELNARRAEDLKARIQEYMASPERRRQGP
jgi:4-amino-4-deoxy-L-arabinose transferase-like glycosyltransferase